MDLTKTKDFAQAFKEYCTSVGMSCHGCQIKEAGGLCIGSHLSCDYCLGWSLSNMDVSAPILQAYLDAKPFIPVFGEYYYHVIVSGNIEQTRFNESPFDYLCALAKNCFRTKEAAQQNKDKILAKYDAINNGKWPD